MKKKSKERIKLKANYFPYLEAMVRDYRKYGYKLIKIRPVNFWEDGITLTEHVAILEHD